MFTKKITYVWFFKAQIANKEQQQQRNLSEFRIQIYHFWRKKTFEPEHYFRGQDIFETRYGHLG